MSHETTIHATYGWGVWEGRTLSSLVAISEHAHRAESISIRSHPTLEQLLKKKRSPNSRNYATLYYKYELCPFKAWHMGPNHLTPPHRIPSNSKETKQRESMASFPLSARFVEEQPMIRATNLSHELLNGKLTKNRTDFLQNCGRGKDFDQPITDYVFVGRVCNRHKDDPFHSHKAVSNTIWLYSISWINWRCPIICGLEPVASPSKRRLANRYQSKHETATLFAKVAMELFGKRCAAILEICNIHFGRESFPKTAGCSNVWKHWTETKVNHGQAVGPQTTPYMAIICYNTPASTNKETHQHSNKPSCRKER